MIQMILEGAALVLLPLALLALKWVQKETYKRGQSDRDNQTLEAENEALSNRPITDSDLINRLRKRAANQRQDNG